MKIKLELDDKRLKRGFIDFPGANIHAVKNTLNTVAALSRKNAIMEVKKDFTLRNTFTTRNIQFDKAQGSKLPLMRSRIGATKRADYLETQEDGGKRKLSRHSSGSTAIPHKPTRIGRSAGQVVSTDFYLRTLRKNTVRGKMTKRFKSPKARMVARLYVGHRKDKFVKRGDGSILKVNQFSKTGRNSVSARTALLYTLVKQPIFIKPSPWLEPAIQKPSRDLPNIYKSNLKKEWKTGKFI